jgi:hypothetical protein
MELPCSNRERRERALGLCAVVDRFKQHLGQLHEQAMSWPQTESESCTKQSSAAPIACRLLCLRVHIELGHPDAVNASATGSGGQLQASQLELEWQHELVLSATMIVGSLMSQRVMMT